MSPHFAQFSVSICICQVGQLCLLIFTKWNYIADSLWCQSAYSIPFTRATYPTHDPYVYCVGPFLIIKPPTLGILVARLASSPVGCQALCHVVVAGPLLSRAQSWHDWLFSPSGPRAGAGLLVGGTRGQGGCLQDLGKPRTGTPPLVGRVISQGSLMHRAAYWAFIFICVSLYVTSLLLFSAFKIFYVLGFEQFGLMFLDVIFFISCTWGSFSFLNLWVHSFHKIW